MRAALGICLASLALACAPDPTAEPTPDAAADVTSCAQAIRAVSGGGDRPQCTSFTCTTEISCADFGYCFACPYYVECVSGRVQVQLTGIPCDTGVP